MKRILTMISDEKAILIKENSTMLIQIDRNKMEITGEQIYECLFKDIPLNEKIEIEINGKESLSKNDTIVYDRFNELIQTIVNEINKISTTSDKKVSA